MIDLLPLGELWLPPRPAIIRPADRGLVNASILPGMFPAGMIAAKAAAVPASIAFVGVSHDNTASATPSYAGVAIGAADATRRVRAIVHWTVSNAARTLVSATIGGVAATIEAQTTTGPTSAQLDTGIAIFSALVPTGTTATVAMTFSNTVTRTSLGIYRQINEVNNTPHATMTDNTLSSNVNSGTIDIPLGGTLLAGSIAATTAGQSNTWTGVTETVDTPHPNAAGILNMEGSETGLGVQTGRTVSTLITGTAVRGVLAAVSWG